MRITLDTPLDMHLHLRDGAMLRAVAPLSAAMFAGAVIMPNLVPPVDNIIQMERYRAEVLEAVAGSTFTPLMTLFFKQYDEAELRQARNEILGIKLYPAGITTNSEQGVQDLRRAMETMALMEELQIPLLVHGESNGFVMDREAEFLPVYEEIARTFPRLRVVMEHITTQAAVAFLERHENVFATITLHHLLITLDDVAGGLLQPHLFCKPIAKRPEDRAALLQAALDAHPKVMFGSDSAPHPRHAKESAGCAAGVFSAPVALPALAELFERHDALDRLQAFVSDNARRIHGLQLRRRTVMLEREPFTVPERYLEVIPFLAGQTLAWRVVDAEG